MNKRNLRRFSIEATGTVLFLSGCCTIAPSLFNGLPAAFSRESSALTVVYPRSGAVIDSRATFIIGAASPGASVTCNSEPVRTNGAGFFAHVVKLNRGENSFNIVGGGVSAALTVRRPHASAPASLDILRFKTGTLEPAESVGVVPGDVLHFSARATPGSKVVAKLGNRTIPLFSAAQRSKGSPVNMGLDTAFGVTFQKNDASLPDTYTGFYKVAPEDLFAGTRPSFVLTKDKRVVTASGPATVSVLRQPSVFHTRHDDTIVRVGPGAARVTPWGAGVRVLSDGYRGPWRRLEVAPGKHLWVSGEDLDPEPPGSPLPESRVTTVNLLSDDYGARVAIPLNQRLPYQVDQDLKAGTLTLRVFGATADTDFVTADAEEGHILPKERASSRLIDYVTFRQKNDQLYELTVHLKKKHQWGYYVDYADSTLALHVKSPPVVDSSAGSLKGVTICVDPGHGGKEPGAFGCDGTKEAIVNLAIAEKLKESLEKMGASVVMTRTADIDVSLAQRVKTAIESRADLLVSVHNNSLPDGRDPWKEHGTSTYWYHPQSVEPAKTFKDGLVQDVDLQDFGSRFQNLFLCRPTQMPAVLVEVGFMIHPDEFLRLITPDFQAKVGASLAESIRSYLVESSPN